VPAADAAVSAKSMNIFFLARFLIGTGRHNER